MGHSQWADFCVKDSERVTKIQRMCHWVVSDAGYVSLDTVSLINSREKERRPVLSGQTLLILVMLNPGSMKDGRGYRHTTHWFMSRYKASSQVLSLLPRLSSLIWSDKQSVHLTVKLHAHWLMMCDSEGFRFFFINICTTTGVAPCWPSERKQVWTASARHFYINSWQ